MRKQPPKDSYKNFRRAFSYNEILKLPCGFDIKHVSEFHSIKYDEERKGVPYDECYLFTVGALMAVTGYTRWNFERLFQKVEPDKRLPVEYVDSRRQKWFSTAYIKTVEHHRRQSYNYKSRKIFTKLCMARLRYICGDIDYAPKIEDTQMALKNARAKGSKFENDIAKELKELYPKARRGLQFQNNRFTGVAVPDVDHTPFWVECKHNKRPNLRAALQQAIEDAESVEDTRIPLAVTRGNFEKPLATLRFSDFFGIIKELELLRAKVRAFQDFPEVQE